MSPTLALNLTRFLTLYQVLMQHRQALTQASSASMPLPLSLVASNTACDLAKPKPILALTGSAAQPSHDPK